VVEEAPHFVDAALAKGAPIQQILDEIQRLLAGAVPVSALSGYVRLGEALAAVVGAVLLIQRVWK
jgi:hypothetical protein